MHKTYDVTTYPRGKRYHFKLLLLAQGKAGASGHFYDSGSKVGEGYLSEEEAKKAGWDVIKGITSYMLTLFIERWPNGCTMPEWGEQSPPAGFPAILWDLFFLDLMQVGWIQEQSNRYLITDKGKEVQTQLM